MQEVYHDGTEGEVKKGKTLEDLLPEIKKSLKDPRVKFVKVFMMPGRKRKKCVAVKEKTKTLQEEYEEIFHGDEGEKK